MDTDLLLVIGIMICALAIPSLMSAWVDNRVPRAGAILVLIGSVLVVVAINRHSGGYAFSELPDVFFNVMGRYLK